VKASAAELRLGSVDVGMVSLRVDEWFHCVFRSSAGDECPPRLVAFSHLPMSTSANKLTSPSRTTSLDRLAK